MRLLILVLMLAACTRPAPQTPAPVVPDCPPPPAAPVAKAPPVLDDATVIARSEALLDAISRHDVAAFDAATSPAFVQFKSGRTYDKRSMITGFEARKQAAATRPVTRTCERQRVIPGSVTIAYFGTCNESVPASDDMPAYQLETFHTVVHALEGDTWRVVHWQWRTAGLDAERENWDITFRQGIGFKQTENSHLRHAVKGRRPGKALDIAMGQGRNVLYLASRGWKVTGVDISEEGIRLAKEKAAKQKLTFEAVVSDIEKYDLGKDRWDLVTLIYAGARPALIERIKPSIKRGGLFVLEFFHEEATAGTGIGGIAAGALAKQFEGWTILTDEVVEDIADWGLRKSKLVRFTAQRK